MYVCFAFLCFPIVLKLDYCVSLFSYPLFNSPCYWILQVLLPIACSQLEHAAGLKDILKMKVCLFSVCASIKVIVFCHHYIYLCDLHCRLFSFLILYRCKLSSVHLCCCWFKVFSGPRLEERIQFQILQWLELGIH